MMGKRMPQLDILYHQLKVPVPGTGYSLLTHCPNESNRLLQISQAIVKAISYSPQSDGKTLS